jgi:GNAT superfamily N-acetyltransferase
VIRHAAAGEAALVHAAMIAAFEEYRGLPLPSSALEESIEDVARAMTGDPAIAGSHLTRGALLAFDGDACVGSVRWALEPDALSFARLAVVPSHRGKGLGLRFVMTLEDIARAEGRELMRITARSQQPDNRPFYQRLGYVITGYSPRYGVPDITTHMEKRLK